MKRIFLGAMMAAVLPWQIEVMAANQDQSGPKNSKTKQILKASKLEHIRRYIEDASAKYHLEPALLRAVIWVESRFNHKAVSRVGARGLMQLMPKTARALGARKALDYRFPKKNIFTGAKYLREQINSFRGDLKLALAAYNAGPTAVRKYGKIPPFQETQKYVKKVMRRLKIERRKIFKTAIL